jgi:leader peptidase (prepilin peptidase) / N-methyltransferase
MGAAPPRELLALFACLFGLVIGSFLNVVIHRLPRGASLLRPGSHCPGCGAPVEWFDNVPVLAWLWLRGRCRRCAAPISWRYPAVELATGLVFAAIAWRYGWQPMTPIWCAFAAALIAGAVIDFDHQIIPDEISLGGLVVALLLVPLARVASGADWLHALAFSAGGAALGGGVFWLVGFAHARVATAMGRTFEHWPGEGEPLPTPGTRDYWMWFPGVGFGDVKLLAMIGAVLGPIGVLQTILAASLSGLALGLAWAVALRRLGAPFGFGPALAAGALLVVLAPDLLPA